MLGESGEFKLQAGGGGFDSLSRKEGQGFACRLEVHRCSLLCLAFCFHRSIAETHYQLGVAQAHCTEYANAEKSLAAAVAVLNTRIANLKKMESSENITKELADLTLLCTEIKERMSDHKEMQKGTYKEDRDFVSIFKGDFIRFHNILMTLLLRSRGARDRHQEICGHCLVFRTCVANRYEFDIKWQLLTLCHLEG